MLTPLDTSRIGRVRLQNSFAGTLPGACHAAGMTRFLKSHQIRIFDYPRFAEPLRERIREHAEQRAATHRVIAKAHIRKADGVEAVIKTRGDYPGLVHIISAMEACSAYSAWHDKQPPDFPAARLGQVPAFPLLFHRSRPRTDVCAGTHLAPM